jgi:hypothetical protein
MKATSRSGGLPVAIIGAGPIGLVAAVHVLRNGMTPLVLEAGPGPGTSLLEWGHVHVFSPWKYMVDPASRELLESRGWTMPDEEGLPSGAELVERFLEPLAQALVPHVLFERRVIAVTRRDMDKVRSGGREDSPFELVVTERGGGTRSYLARAVIDASGTYGQPNPLGSNGLAVPGERDSGGIEYGIPDVNGTARARYASRRTLVVGSGHSAFNALLDLVRLKIDAPATEIDWAIRRTEPGLMFGGGAKDALPARGSLGAKLRELVALDVIRLEMGFRTSEVSATEDGIIVRDGDRQIGPYDNVIVTTGFRPDLDMLRELRLALDPSLEAPVRLAPLIDPNVHSCGTVYPHGYEELRHPEHDFFIAGMKSYGRAPTFLLLTGYEQVRSIASALAGDIEAAREVHLVLPGTGVCSTDLSGGTCCAPAPAAATGQAAALAGAVEGAEAHALAGVGGGCGC